MGDFFAEKGLATFNLGLIYHSIALSQQQSRDTVSLKIHNEFCIETPNKIYFFMLFLTFVFSIKQSSLGP
jgi:hypothetical protein